MLLRSDIIESIKTDMAVWHWECMDEAYKDEVPSKLYEKIATVRNVSDKEGNMGGYFKETLGIGLDELPDRDDYGLLQEDRPQAGFTQYALIKQKGIKVSVPRELQRDGKAGAKNTKDWLKGYIKENWKLASEETKEKIVADFINYGGYTSGDAKFNNDKAELSLSTYTSPNLGYDGKPPVNLSGNTRTAKSGSTYYNGLSGAAALPTLGDVAKPMFYLMTSTNAFKDNGQPFDNSKNIKVIAPTNSYLDWKAIIASDKVADDASNKNNPLRGQIKEEDIINYPYYTAACKTAYAAVMIRKGWLKVWFSQEPEYDFWYDNEAKVYKASILFDYAAMFKNFRLICGYNLPTS